ncbi:MAG: HamA C-terminal domain-containing protein [Nitrososphaerales archaeon]
MIRTGKKQRKERTPNFKKLPAFRKYLEKLRNKRGVDLSPYLHTLDTKNPTSSITCKFFLPTCDADNVRENDFIEFLSTKIIDYVIESKMLDPKRMQDPSYATDLYRRARRKFSLKNPNSAEVGELILFVLLESQGIIQIVQKMPLKTNREMPLHGADGIHVQVKDGLFILHFGESKMHANLNGAINKSIESIESITDEETGKRKLELDIIATHIDNGKFEQYADLITELVAPYAKDKRRCRDINSIFIGYNWDQLSKLSERGKSELTTFLMRKFRETHDEISEKIVNAVTESKKLKNQHFHVQFIPFIDTGKFCTRFKKEL